MFALALNKRVQLTWARVKDNNIQYYRVYRSTKPDVKRSDLMIMEVDHKQLPVPVYSEQDLLQKEDDTTYRMRYQNIMPHQEDYPIRIYLNGILLEDLNIDYAVDVDAGLLYLAMRVAESDELTATYYIDGIRVYDTDEVEQEGVRYRGPTARDRTENDIPSNVFIRPEPENGRIKVEWDDCNTVGQAYYYRVESVDEYGNFSVLSVETMAFIREGLDTEAYIIERSYDGERWTAIATSGIPGYYEYGIDTNPPLAPASLSQKTDLKTGTGKADVTLTWHSSNLGYSSITGQYRVRSKSVLGVLSSPSAVVGPVYLTSDITRYVIRRKTYNGSFPTYAGNDAITVGIVNKDTLSFTDYNVPDNQEYAYSVYAIDAAENPSIAATILVTLEDATPPDTVSDIRISQHSYITFTGSRTLPAISGLRAFRHDYVIQEEDVVPPHAVTQVKAFSYFDGL